MLPILAAIPLISIFCIFHIDEKENADNIRMVTIWTASFLLAICVFFSFYEEYQNCFSFFSVLSNANHLSSYVILVTSFLILMIAIFSRTEINKYAKRFYSILLLLECVLFLGFSSTNILIFYTVFEFALCLQFLLIGFFSTDKKAAYKFFIAQLLSSFCMLAGILYIINIIGITEISVLSKYTFSQKQESFIFLMLFSAFYGKALLFPLQVLLPKLHDSIPTSISIILSGIIPNIGVFGMITVLLPIIPTACLNYSKSVICISFVSIFFALFQSIFEKNFKKVIAHISTIQMSFIVIGIFTCHVNGVSGAFFNAISNSIIISSLLIISQIAADKFQRKSLQLSGLFFSARKLSIIFTLTILAISNIPGLPIFVGNMLILSDYYNIGYLASIMLVFVMASCIFRYLKIYHCIFRDEAHNVSCDILTSEFAQLIPFVILMISLGLFPNAIVKHISTNVEKNIGEARNVHA